MPAERDDRSAPPQAEIGVCRRIVVALRATGAIVPALAAGHDRTLRVGRQTIKDRPPYSPVPFTHPDP